MMIVKDMVRVVEDTKSLIIAVQDQKQIVMYRRIVNGILIEKVTLGKMKMILEIKWKKDVEDEVMIREKNEMVAKVVDHHDKGMVQAKKNLTEASHLIHLEKLLG